jgi:hypothetical protein
MLPNVVTEWLTFLFRIRRSQVQILAWKPVFQTEGFRCFHRSFQAYGRIMQKLDHGRFFNILFNSSFTYHLIRRHMIRITEKASLNKKRIHEFVFLIVKYESYLRSYKVLSIDAAYLPGRKCFNWSCFRGDSLLMLASLLRVVRFGSRPCYWRFGGTHRLNHHGFSIQPWWWRQYVPP